MEKKKKKKNFLPNPKFESRTIKGIGPKTAQTLMQKHGTMEKVRPRFSLRVRGSVCEPSRG